jgi:hypothetical protein
MAGTMTVVMALGASGLAFGATTASAASSGSSQASSIATIVRQAMKTY